MLEDIAESMRGPVLYLRYQLGYTCFRNHDYDYPSMKKFTKSFDHSENAIVTVFCLC